ncbi:MAG: hypothetical protein RLZZ299_3173 [Pseudomonadota bacterium]|jgi:hypothetical protein
MILRLVLLPLLACDGKETPPIVEAALWDRAAPAVSCDEAAAYDLLDSALSGAGLAREALGTTEREWSSFSRLVEDMPLSWFAASHHAPMHASCVARQQQADADTAARAFHPVAATLGAMAPWADAPVSPLPPTLEANGLEAALADLVEAAGGGDDPARASQVPAPLADLLGTLLPVLTGAVRARFAMDAAVENDYRRLTARLYRDAGDVILGGSALPDITDPDEMDWYRAWYGSSDGPRSLAVSARAVAWAVEEVDWSAVRDVDVAWTFQTEAGAIRISPRGDDTHTADEDPVLLHIELGGDDTYTGAAGANADAFNPVSVLLDLEGDDRYGYVEVAHPNDVDGVLPSDADGRLARGGYPMSLSDTARQGSGRYGVGLLFDRGGGTDQYRSLRRSQGAGALGVGVLHDDGGDDTYEAEAASQGSGVFGLGLLLDGGGNDVYRSWAFSQGFGYVGSGGWLVDVDGNDDYWADPGRDYGGVTLYASPQLPGGQGNSSFSQGAGFGMRADAYETWLGGGFGMLRDLAGDDSYQAGVFSQGTGYWQGVGLLADASGDDAYDALYYMQAGVAHFALGIFMDGAGDDVHGGRFAPLSVHGGSGHDFSLGIFVDEGGDDRYRSASLSMGASNCQGVGIFVDTDGTDVYEAATSYGYGLGNHSGECDESTGRTRIAGSEGVFLDAGGDVDTYAWPADDTRRAPANDSSFGIRWAETGDEFGAAVDGDGATGFSARP